LKRTIGAGVFFSATPAPQICILRAAVVQVPHFFTYQPRDNGASKRVRLSPILKKM
jgi:hypothetical protein